MLDIAPIVTEGGDLQLHGREGIVLPFVFQEDDGTPRDMTGATVTFEIQGFTKNLTTTEDPSQMLLTLNQGEIPDTIGRVVDFVVVDQSGPVPHVIWAGKLVQTGWR